MEYEHDHLEKVVALAKRRGFIFQGSELYGGLAGTWDYGPLGVALKRAIKESWWKKFVTDREDMYGLDAALLMNASVWEASGHVAGFTDPLVEDIVTHKRYRADHILEQAGIAVAGLSVEGLDAAIKTHGIKSPEGNALSSVRSFNMMFKTQVGAVEDSASTVYLRPETAQGIFVNFKNILDSMHPKLPFGIAQIGKAFRNEITPRDFIFRTREFEQMEIEYFVRPHEWERYFEYFKDEMIEWMASIGISLDAVHEYEVPVEDRAHYSKRTVDFEFDFPFGKKELFGLAYRTDFDLTAHAGHAKVPLYYFDEETKEKIVPHVIEPTFGVDRAVLALLVSSYKEIEEEGGVRTVLSLPAALAPITLAVSPLLKNKPELIEKARTVFTQIKQQGIAVAWDDNGNIGKRYRRQDEIGTPFCLVVDFDTLEDDTVTIRLRDTATQVRMPLSEVVTYIKNAL